MTWDILKTNINKYANDFNTFHTRDDVLTKTVTEITNFVNTNTKTFSGNSIYINPEPLLSGLKSIDKVIETVTMEAFDVDLSNINIEKSIMDIINNNTPKSDVANIIKIPLDYGVTLDIPIINEDQQEYLQDLINGLIQDKLTLDIMLSNPLMDFNKIVELFPKIDIKESIGNLELPNVDVVVSEIMKKALDFMISSAMITPTQSALPGGVPMSEQIISTGFGGSINLSSGNLFDELLKMLETQLKTVTIVNVSSYNGVITPVTGVGIT